MALTWVPQLSFISKKETGYCSSACGRGCTLQEYEQAKHRANELATRLNKKLGPGWKATVFENLGWHYRVDKGICSVRGMDGRMAGRYFTACFNGVHSWSESAPTPERAVTNGLQWLMKYEAKLIEQVEGVLR